MHEKYCIFWYSARNRPRASNQMEAIPRLGEQLQELLRITEALDQLREQAQLEHLQKAL